MYSGGKNHYVSGRSSSHQGNGERHNFERVDGNKIEGKKMFKKFEIYARKNAKMSKSGGLFMGTWEQVNLKGN